MSMKFQEDFWRAPLPLPRGVELLRQDSLVVPQRGPGGQAIYELIQVKLPQALIPALLAYRAPLFPVDVPRLRDRLQELDGSLRRHGALRAFPPPRVPMIATDVASPGLIEVCEQEGVALVDLRGTLVLNAGNAFIRIRGQGPFQRTSRAPIFHGKGSRLIRVLLSEPGRAWTLREMEEKTQTAYSYAQGVMARLEKDGYLKRSSKKSGFRVRDPAGLMRAWLGSGRRTAAVVDGFNAPSTTSEVLQRGGAALTALGVRFVFTLASGMLSEERFASGLPHGIYSSAPLEELIQAFGLRRMTPHNFWVMRPEVAADTQAGGVYFMPRELSYGPGVALPQLIVDLHFSAGRGKEQAEVLLDRYVKELPLLLEESPSWKK